MFKRFIIAFTLLAVLSFAWFFGAVQPVTHGTAAMVDFEIKTGNGIDQIANNLNSAHLIRSRIAFKLTVIRLGIASKIQAGYFKLSPTMDATAIAEALTHAYARQVRVTLPEGLRSEEINNLLEKAFSAVKDNKYNPTEFAKLTKNLEGHLFPDTYDFSPSSTAADIVNRLTTRFDQVVAELQIPADQISKTLIIASLLERESGSAGEMPSVAGVINNRLNIGMALQIDATVQYALGSVHCKQINCDWWTQSLSLVDLKFNSPYNTYLHSGLPVGPISNPGKDALSAAFHPAKTTALYYLHDASGKIHFADTLKQHDQNICTYLHKSCP